MNRTHSPIPTVKSPFHFVLSPNFKSLIHPTATRILNFPPKHPNRLPLLSYCSKSPNFRFISKKRNFEVKASTGSNNGEAGNWVRWLPTGGLAADKVLRLISTATSSPICQFISSPTTFLHSVDPRIKLVWLLALVVLPARAQIAVRFGLVAYIALLSMLFLPKNVWMIFQSASLCLATTTPEQLAFALRWFMLPLRYIGVPVAEIVLTLMLSLRFINLVFDEVRNVALGIVSRRINWQHLTMKETIDIFASYIQRIFKNIFKHAEQISQAMIVRGFRGDSNAHKLYFLSDSSIGIADLIAVVCLIGVTSVALLSEYLLV
ncbi:protein ABCI12, chloroplastic isoform X2 [Gossypium hirsutum]|uniref:Protein ABCI12, chloroplastic isoform X2 n=1 Tax=Gossypium hirsutum TaxID=3635 RepID=A0ABM3AQP1_GOSHI|nr:protein ABCI12, chloroplastic isoform X2 [Gossypium hirsutum]